MIIQICNDEGVPMFSRKISSTAYGFTEIMKAVDAAVDAEITRVEDIAHDILLDQGWIK
jgi:hypothetical protein